MSGRQPLTAGVRDVRRRSARGPQDPQGEQQSDGEGDGSGDGGAQGSGEGGDAGGEDEAGGDGQQCGAPFHADDPGGSVAQCCHDLGIPRACSNQTVIT
ncbi:hypothetical protein C5E43_07105 [Nocardia cyriacigeorgica]|nr:hypothetical protein C5B73_15515 [Nocardia cyriacigeorgica]PPJ14583.1 hypothetical protein C5E43_07105 [Nocardia cyriacigeorgica]